MNGHPQDALLDYAYGELAAEETRALEAHLGGCEACRRELSQIRGVRKAMAQLAPEPAPQAGLESLLAYAEKAAARAKTDPPRSELRWLWPLVGALAALCVVVVVSDRNLRRAQPSVALVAPAKLSEKNEASFGSAAPEAQAEAKLARNDLTPVLPSATAPLEPAREIAHAKKMKQQASAGGSFAFERVGGSSLGGEAPLEKAHRTLDAKEHRIVAVLEPRPVQPPPGMAMGMNTRAEPSPPPPPPAAAPARRVGGSIAKIDSLESPAPAPKPAGPRRAASRKKAVSIASADRFEPSEAKEPSEVAPSAQTGDGESLALADQGGHNVPREHRSGMAAGAASATPGMGGAIAMADQAGQGAAKEPRPAAPIEAASAQPSMAGPIAMTDQAEPRASKPSPAAAEDVAPETQAPAAAKPAHVRSSAPPAVTVSQLGQQQEISAGIGAGYGLGTAAELKGAGSGGAAANEADLEPAQSGSRAALFRKRARLKAALAHADDLHAARLFESLCRVDLALGRRDWAGADCGQLIRRFPGSVEASRARAMLRPAAKAAATENSQ